MATIIEFRALFCDSSSRERRMAGRSAEIVIFPGVRYNRASESIHKNEQNNSKAARDILELVE